MTHFKGTKKVEDVVIIPAYNPDVRLEVLVEKLHEYGFGILVVNDGSREEYRSVFNRISEKATIVNIEKNGGKGGALKCGMRELLKFFPDCKRFITADADGQHKPEDIVRVRDELRQGSEFVLTVRNFRGDIPARSRFGNDLSRVIYTVLTGHYFRDNQSGLRGFKTEHTEWLTRVGGEKYDYEMNMLYVADKQAIPITTIMIEALYIDGNSSSHFDPIRDTLRIYKRLFKSAWVSFAVLGMVEQLVFVAGLVFGYSFLHITMPIIAAISAGISFALNKFIAFRQYRYNDWFRMIAFTVMKHIGYTFGCLLARFATPQLPMFIAFNLVMIATVPIEYYLRKLIHEGRYRDINKEK